jgi:hypothetical protein
LNAGQLVGQSLEILPREEALAVIILATEIRRVEIEERVRPVVFDGSFLNKIHAAPANASQ